MSGYRAGISLVGIVFAVSAIICFGAASSGRQGASAGSQLLAGKEIAPFILVRENGSPVRSDDLRSGPWLAAFTFTRCPSSCPRISATLKSLQADLNGSSAKIISISVDPEFDTPEVLSRYSERFGADPNRWWFLTGRKDDIFALIQSSFLLSVAATTPEQQKEGAEAIAHSDRIALVDKDLKLVRFFDSNSPEELKQLVAETRRRSLSPWITALPAINAFLNSLSFVLLLSGWFLVRSGRWRSHAFTMLTCLAVSGAFLTCYLTYHSFVGTVRFPGTGWVRSLYLSILLSHTILAVVMVPMILLTVLRAVKKDFERHKAIARITFPIWCYISVTGVVIYLMLYQMNHAPQVLPGI
jgi:protein SCO1/2/putative membrane protein